ncbi:multidrug ABC transporter permease [Acinetobacter qingfengensis]|uniref:Multidrug ABC transporter permease n=1 Tax=Acinetobacter qingfengensis TaxID=1262585 RepID=A0A1E7R1G4_9GAMM|nr:ABC transporter permease [Acinetobacter qingfengensis]OEY93165.1 multidrug ABC transporter permease [Acinetobacter qingfengensis]
MVKHTLRQFFQYYLQTFQNIVKNHSILTTLILSVFLYSFFYPTAYQGQQAEAVPLVIVDQEQSVLTNTIITEIQKSPDIQIQGISSNFIEAEYLVQTQQADAILLLPDHLSQSIRRGDTGGIGLYLSTANFLKTKQIGLGLVQSIEQTLTDYSEQFTQRTHFQPDLSVHQIPLFNTLSGYGSYVFPAVAPVIIHQTLLLGICMLVAGYRQRLWHPTITEFLAFYAAMLTIGCLGCFYLFGFTFWLYDYPRGGNFWGMLLAVPIFVSCVISLAILIASYLDRPERAGHVIVFSSIPLFLMSGAAWPHAAMPEWLQFFVQIFPSTHGVQLFIQLNQMGAHFSETGFKLYYLIAITVLCGWLAWRRLRS